MTHRVSQVILLAPLALLLCCFLTDGHALSSSKTLKQYGRQTWQSDTGLPQNTVHAIAQTRDGFLWLGTDAGLVRFDGQEFRTYDASNTPSLPSDSIDGLVVDGHGTLWITSAGGLARLENGRFVRVEAPGGANSESPKVLRVLKDGEILLATSTGLRIGGEKGFRPIAVGNTEASEDLISEDDEGRLWLASGREVIAVNERSGAVVQRLPVADVGELAAIATGPNGDVWIGGREGLELFRRNVRVPLELPAGRSSITTILSMKDGRVWFGMNTGLILYSAGKFERVRDGGVVSGSVVRLFSDRKGAVWAVFNGGVTRIQGDSGKLQNGMSAKIQDGPSLKLEDAIDLPGVLSIFEDSEGDMWFGTDAGGATVLRDEPFSTLTVQDGLSDDFVRAVFQDHLGRVWIGTNRGGLNEIADGKITAFKSGKTVGLASNVILAIAEAEGDICVGTPDGLSRIHNGVFKPFASADGLPDGFVRSLYTDMDGSLWIGTRGGLSNYAHGKLTSYSTLDGLGSDLIGSIFRSKDGTLWVGTLGGISRFDGTNFKNFTRKNGLGGDAITAIAEDNEGTLWIAAHGAGLTRLRAGVFTAIPSGRRGLPADIYSILEDRSAGSPASLWMGTAKGVYRVSLAQLNGIADGSGGGGAPETFGVADGMKISECSSGGRPAGWRMQDGSLWFATLKGVASITPGIAIDKGQAPLVSIERIGVDDQVVMDSVSGLPVEVNVPPGRERLTIQYAAPSFRAPQNVVFRYMLEKFDRGWVQAGSRRTAYYTNIPAGGYRFLVQASKGDNIWSTVPGDVRVVVRPHFYRAWWFYFLVLLLLLCLIYGVYRLRVKSVEASYQAVIGERNRIAREIHDTLAQGYVGVSLQLEIVGRMLKGSRAADEAPGPAEAQIELTKTLVKTSLDEARSSIWNLRSSQLDAEAGTLPARLAAAVRVKQDGSKAAIRLTVTGTFRPLEPSVEDEVLRIGQEAVSNAVRHASAAEIEVVLKYDSRWLELKISDDGKGFTPVENASFGHYGLQGMQERADAIGAKFRVETSPGAGTTIRARLGISGQATGKTNAGRSALERKERNNDD